MIKAAFDGQKKPNNQRNDPLCTPQEENKGSSQTEFGLGKGVTSFVGHLSLSQMSSQMLFLKLHKNLLKELKTDEFKVVLF